MAKTPVPTNWTNEDIARLQISFEIQISFEKVAETFRHLVNSFQDVAGTLEYLKDRSQQDADR